MRRQAQKHFHIYVNPQGVGAAVSGLEIKERTTAASREAAKELRGSFVDGVGFFSDSERAWAVAETQNLLARLKARIAWIVQG